MPLPKKTEYTLEDIYALPDGQRAELISGQLYMMAPPSTRHQRLVNFLTTEINLYIRKKQGKCKAAFRENYSWIRRKKYYEEYIDYWTWKIWKAYCYTA